MSGLRRWLIAVALHRSGPAAGDASNVTVRTQFGPRTAKANVVLSPGSCRRQPVSSSGKALRILAILHGQRIDAAE